MTPAHRPQRFFGIPFRTRQALRAGGIAAYPTEGVYGLGCDPDDPAALAALVALKGRSPDKGLILIGAEADDVLPYIAAAPGPVREALDQPPAERATTWVVPASGRCHPLLTGGRETIAVRITHHPTAARLCRAFGGALVSTSANTSGSPPVRRPMLLVRRFRNHVDALLPRANGRQVGVSRVVDLQSGRVLRD